jgi:hypothetical protein
VRVFESPRRRPAKDIPPVLTPNELALLGPADVRGLKQNGSNGSRTRSTRANGTAKKTTARRTTKRTTSTD